jgi:hypothetical protein
LQEQVTVQPWISYVAAPLISGLAALAGALGAQWLARRSQREQAQFAAALERERRIDEVRVVRRRERQEAYAELLTAADELTSAALLNHYQGQKDLLPAFDRLARAYQRVRLLAPEQVAELARRVCSTVIATAAAESREKLPQPESTVHATDAFIRAALADLFPEAH